MAQHGSIVNEPQTALDGCKGVQDVTVVGGIEVEIVNGGIIGTALRNDSAREGITSGRNPPLSATAAEVMAIKSGEVGTERATQVGVSVVIAQHVEGLAPAPALSHAAADEMAQHGSIVNHYNASGASFRKSVANIFVIR